MEKLIELLNEYEKERYEKEIKSSSYYWGISNGKLECSVGGTDHDLYDDEIAMVIKSKQYGFIKWLVENEKIDFEGKLNTLRFEGLVNQTLDSSLALYMLLSIQDEPIDFLISFLK